MSNSGAVFASMAHVAVAEDPRKHSLSPPVFLSVVCQWDACAVSQ